RVSAKLAVAYERRTKICVYLLALVAVFAFNVDAIRVLRVLSVSADTRKALATVAEKRAEMRAEQKGEMDKLLPATLSEWQKENFAELQGTGLPLGWDRAPLAVYERGDERVVKTWNDVWTVRSTAAAGAATDGQRPPESLALGATTFLWLVRLLGL